MTPPLPPLQAEASESLITAGAYALAGLAYGAVSYLSKRDSEDEFRPRQLAKTLAVFAVAGFIAYTQGDELSETTIVAATAIAAPIVNVALDYVIPPEAGGSPTKGRGGFVYGRDG